MKKAVLFSAAIFFLSYSGRAQNDFGQQMQSAVAKLDQATTVKDYQQLAGEFESLAQQGKTQWLPYYYAAFCNAKIGWLYQQDGDAIEPFANQAEKDIKRSESLIDTASQKRELSEVYCVISMVNQARVFVNPMSFGSQFGPVASRYRQLALKANPDNPRANYLIGWEKYSTPKLWGGDKKKAKELLELAKQQLAASPDQGISPHWGQKEVDGLLKELK